MNVNFVVQIIFDLEPLANYIQHTRPLRSQAENANFWSIDFINFAFFLKAYFTAHEEHLNKLFQKLQKQIFKVTQNSMSYRSFILKK